MKNNFLEIFKFLLFLFLSALVIVLFADFGKSNNYKVLEVVSGDTFYVDLNKDGKKGEDELVKLNLVKTFSYNLNNNPDYILKFYNLTSLQAQNLGPCNSFNWKASRACSCATLPMASV